MPWKPFDALEANLDRLLSAFSDEEIMACRADFSRRMKRILTDADEVDQNSLRDRIPLTNQEAIERYGTAALTLRALVRGRNPLWSVDLTGEDLSRRRDPRLTWQLNPSSQIPAVRAR